MKGIDFYKEIKNLFLRDGIFSKGSFEVNNALYIDILEYQLRFDEFELGNCPSQSFLGKEYVVLHTKETFDIISFKENIGMISSNEYGKGLKFGLISYFDIDDADMELILKDITGFLRKEIIF